MPNYLKGKLPQFGVGDELIFRLYMIYRNRNIEIYTEINSDGLNLAQIKVTTE